MKKITLIISIILCSSSVFSQDNNNFGGIRKNAISFNLLGTTPVIGLTYKRIVSNHVSLEVGVGLPSIGIGAKVFFSEIQEYKNDV